MESCGAEQHRTAAAWGSLLEASADSESDDLLAVAVSIDVDDGNDAASCSGGDGLEMEELDDVAGKRLVSRESASVVVAGAKEGACCPMLSTEEDAEGDRLFWEACIAHGY